MKLYLIRHAQSANNVHYGTADERDHHVPDPEITGTGHDQGKNLARHLCGDRADAGAKPYGKVANSDFGLTHLYCSLMTRSLLTADYVAEASGLKLEILPDVFERKGLYRYGENGEPEGVAGPGRGYFEDRFPGVVIPEGIGHEGWWNRPMENEPDFLARVDRSVEDLLTRHGGTDDAVALVTHGDYIDQFVNVVMGRGREAANYRDGREATWVFHNTSISRIDIMDNARTVIYLNRVDHLPAELVTW